MFYAVAGVPPGHCVVTAPATALKKRFKHLGFYPSLHIVGGLNTLFMPQHQRRRKRAVVQSGIKN
jgi:hypothetical protein